MRINIGKAPGLRSLFLSLSVWILSAFLLLVLSSFLLARSEAGSHVLGYVSSSISFLSALLASVSFAVSGGKKSLVSALLFGLLLVIFLLTLGFLAGERSLDPSGVLSVVSFTFAGVLLGCLLPRRLPSRKSNRKRFSIPR